MKKKYSQDIPITATIKSKLDGGDSRIKHNFPQPE